MEKHDNSVSINSLPIHSSESDELHFVNEHITAYKKQKSKVNNNILDFLRVSAIISGIILYVASLEGCSSNIEIQCWQLFFRRLKFLLVTGTVACVCFSFVYISAFFNKRLNSLIFSIATFVIQILLYSLDDGVNFQKHGQYNRLYMIVFTSFLVFLVIISYYLIKLIKKTNKFILLFVSLYVIYLVYLSLKRVGTSCENWDKGFKNTRIDNTVACAIQTPTYCLLNITLHNLDLSRFVQKCSDRKQVDYKDVETFYKNASAVAFEDTKKYNFTERSNKYIQQRIQNDLIPIDIKNKTILENTELILNRTDIFNPNFIINVPYKNEIKSRSENAKSQFFPLVDNMLIFFFDTISRANFRARLPKVYKWIEQHYENKTSPLESYQFFKLHGTHSSTFMSVNEMFSGKYPFHHMIDPQPLIHEIFKQSGFVTGHGINECSALEYDYQPDFTDVIWDNYDHELFALFCDPQYYIPGRSTGMYVGPYSAFRRCLYKKDTFEYVLEFGEKFMKTYKDNKKFLLMSFIDGHEFTNEVITYVDDHIYDWLIRHEQQIYDGKTGIMFVSDHGLHMAGTVDLRGASDITTEYTLPNLHILLPRKLADNFYGRGLKENENMLVSFYDVNSFLREMAGAYTRSYLSIGLFFKKLENTTCENITVREENCRCFKK